ncbi:hypothetical protein EMIT051CA3_20912 [Pseudomonas chlororaphis]
MPGTSPCSSRIKAVIGHWPNGRWRGDGGGRLSTVRRSAEIREPQGLNVIVDEAESMGGGHAPDRQQRALVGSAAETGPG